jgi:hypothetical protein
MRLKLEFSSLMHRAELINLVNDSTSAFDSLDNYDKFAQEEYLNVSHSHLLHILLVLAALLGRISRIRSIHPRNESLLYNQIDLERNFERKTQELKDEVSAEEMDVIKEVSRECFSLFSDNWSGPLFLGTLSPLFDRYS